MNWSQPGRRAVAEPVVYRVVFVVTLCLAVAGCSSKGTPASKKGDGAVPVTVALVTQKNVPVDIQVVGNVEAYSTVTIKAQASGEVTKVGFQQGDYVKKGDLLYTIDPRPLQGALQQAEANLARDEAQEKQAEANLARDTAQTEYAKAQAGRYEKLFRNGVISKEQADQFQSNADAMMAAVNADKAAIASARAAAVATKAMVESARVQLGYTTIRSPIEGRTGNLVLKEGNIVTANSTELITINQVQPIYVTFSVPEAQLSAIKEYMARAKLQVIVIPRDGESYRDVGELTFTDNTVDPTTGTIKLKGTFANPDRKLWPGEFVRVALRLTTQNDAMVVPNQAVQTGQEGPYVFVVKADKTVESRPVVTGVRIDQELVVEKGLVPGETVVTEGHLRLAPGSRVQIRGERAGAAKKTAS